MPYAVAVVGPTASGKSELGLRIAETFDGEIVNYDSVQIYRYFNTGSAKLAERERRGVPHHLVDIAEPDELFTAGEYARRASEAVRDIAGRGRLPVLVGGTGFYLRALLDGLSPGPQRDEAVRARLAARDPARLHRLLRRLDPDAARRIHANDKNKLMRALELRLIAGKPASDLFASRARQGLQGFCTLRIGLDPPRPRLFERIDARVIRMFDAGLIDETRSILARGFAATAKPFEALGYAQALAALEGRVTLAGAIASTQQATRRYAKRQMTWFRREPQIHWLAGFGEDAGIQEQACELVRGGRQAGDQSA